MDGIRALTFDVFGTVVDWRGTIVREMSALGLSRGIEADWAAFADAWRAGYQPAMDLVRRGDLPWTKLDALHRRILDELAPRFGLNGLSEAELDAVNRVWHRLDPWSDAVEGLTRLKRRYAIATLSNGNVSLLSNMAKRAGLPWDVILSAELAGCYKPDPRVYRKAADLLGLEPHEVVMVAAHPSDLRAAAAVGFRTAFVPRPLEHGPGSTAEPAAAGEFDWTAADFVELADRLGA
ncbi:MAG: haloacid dehalogenase type II [Acidobacteria bacterium]|nr:haloacid dehalogenase type II [Acidobacteriota bacterium]